MFKENLTPEQHRKYYNEISRIAFNQPIIQDNGLFNIYNVKEIDVDRIILRLNNLDQIEYVYKHPSGYDYSSYSFPTGMLKQHYTITGQIRI